MSLEIPILTKCCFCVPLRRGLLVLGYLNVFCSIFSIGVTGVWFERNLHLRHEDANVDTEMFDTIIYLTQFVLDFCFNIVLLVGAHRTNARLVKIYFYYGIISLVLSVIIHFALVVYGRHWILLFLTMPETLITLYLLIVIRSAYIKFGRDYPVKYSANDDEV